MGNKVLPMVTNLFGYQISCRGLGGDIAFACHLLASSQSGHYIACANPHSLVVASQDRIFSEALKNADLLLPDGEGIIIASRLLGLPRKERVTGSDFFYGLSAKLSKDRGARYFFLGSTDLVLTLIKERIREDYPNITVCGMLSPPFKEEFSEAENRKMVSAVNAAQPDVLWVGMTAPKQEKWIFKNRARLQVPLIAAVGALFDFYAGTKQRSSLFWQRLGLEWLPRFLREPRRLWKRNMKSTPTFLFWIVKEMVRKGK